MSHPIIPPPLQPGSTERCTGQLRWLVGSVNTFHLHAPYDQRTLQQLWEVYDDNPIDRTLVCRLEWRDVPVIT